MGGLLVLMMLILLLLIVVVVVCVRRAHDQGKTIQDNQLQGKLLCMPSNIEVVHMRISLDPRPSFRFYNG